VKRVVSAVQVIAMLCAAAFVVLLFANEPDHASPSAGSVGTVVDGAAVFAGSCAACHGADGGGGAGIQLSEGKVVALFPNIDDQIRVITNGNGRMPAFGGQLSKAEIQAVAEYIRTL
jgi:cytochrome c oxidase subunit 2